MNSSAKEDQFSQNDIFLKIKKIINTVNEYLNNLVINEPIKIESIPANLQEFATLEKSATKQSTRSLNNNSATSQSTVNSSSEQKSDIKSLIEEIKVQLTKLKSTNYEHSEKIQLTTNITALQKITGKSINVDLANLDSKSITKLEEFIKKIELYSELSSIKKEVKKLNNANKQTQLSVIFGLINNFLNNHEINKWLQEHGNNPTIATKLNALTKLLADNLRPKTINDIVNLLEHVLNQMQRDNNSTVDSQKESDTIKLNPIPTITDIIRAQFDLESLQKCIVKLTEHFDNSQNKKFKNETDEHLSLLNTVIIVGETCQHLSSVLKQNYSDIDWESLIQLRHTVVHAIDNAKTRKNLAKFIKGTPSSSYSPNDIISMLELIQKRFKNIKEAESGTASKPTETVSDKSNSKSSVEKTSYNTIHKALTSGQSPQNKIETRVYENFSDFLNSEQENSPELGEDIDYFKEFIKQVKTISERIVADHTLDLSLDENQNSQAIREKFISNNDFYSLISEIAADIQQFDEYINNGYSSSAREFQAGYIGEQFKKLSVNNDFIKYAENSLTKDIDAIIELRGDIFHDFVGSVSQEREGLYQSIIGIKDAIVQVSYKIEMYDRRNKEFKIFKAELSDEFNKFKTHFDAFNYFETTKNSKTLSPNEFKARYEAFNKALEYFSNLPEDNLVDRLRKKYETIAQQFDDELSSVQNKINSSQTSLKEEFEKLKEFYENKKDEFKKIFTEYEDEIHKKYQHIKTNKEQFKANIDAKCSNFLDVSNTSSGIIPDKLTLRS